MLALTGAGIPLQDVYDLPLDALYLYQDGTLRLEARRRREYIVDTGNTVSSLFSKNSELSKFVDKLEAISKGEQDD